MNAGATTIGIDLKFFITFILLVIICVINSTICQIWSIKPDFPILGITIPASICLFLFFGKTICTITIIAQCLFNIICVSVSDAIHAPLTLSMIFNGARYTERISGSLFYYIPIYKSLFFIICMSIELFLLFKIKTQIAISN